MPTPGYDEFVWLCGPEGAHWLAESAGASGVDPLRLAQRLRKSLSPERTHLVLQQLELRRRARRKFSRAGEMFFTPLSLEQATGERVAAYKAQRFEKDAEVADICCGIGGDLIALCQRCRAIGVDCDPVIGLLASMNFANTSPADASPSRVVVADAHRLPLASEVDLFHIDPDRRSSGRRTIAIEAYAPPLEAIDRLVIRARSAAVKLAPATDVPVSWHEQAELEWISHEGECRQQVAWFGSLANNAGSRRATVLASGGPVRTLAGGENQLRDTSASHVPHTSRIGRYIFDPDAAVLAAGLLHVLALEHGLDAIAPGAAYLTGDAACDDAALAAFEVIEELPFDMRRVRLLIAAKRIGRLEIKKRGVPIKPEQLRRQLRLRGDEEATLIVARRGGAVTAILARRVHRAVTCGQPIE